jgi:hypothetical protein
MPETLTGPLAIQLDDTGGTTYIGEASPGSLTSASAWRIKRVVETGPDSVITWADGDSDFDNIWDNRLSLTYT